MSNALPYQSLARAGRSEQKQTLGRPFERPTEEVWSDDGVDDDFLD